MWQSLVARVLWEHQVGSSNLSTQTKGRLAESGNVTVLKTDVWSNPARVQILHLPQTESKAARWSSFFAKERVLCSMGFEYSVFRNMGCSVGCAGRSVTPNHQGSNPSTPQYAGVAKLVAVLVLGTSVERRGGSSPFTRTMPE